MTNLDFLKNSPEIIFQEDGFFLLQTSSDRLKSHKLCASGHVERYNIANGQKFLFILTTSHLNEICFGMIKHAKLLNSEKVWDLGPKT